MLLLLSSWGGSLFQDFYDEQGVFAENFWPQSEPAQALAFNPRGRVSKALTPPPTTQSINNQVSDRAEAELDSCHGDRSSNSVFKVVNFVSSSLN